MYKFKLIYKFIYIYIIRSMSLSIGFAIGLIGRDQDKRTEGEHHPQEEKNVGTFSKQKDLGS